MASNAKEVIRQARVKAKRMKEGTQQVFFHFLPSKQVNMVKWLRRALCFENI